MATELQDRPDLGQVRVDSGYGRVEEVTTKAGKRNAEVKIIGEGLRIPLTGWLDTTERDVLEAALAAKADGRRVFYVIECHRRGDCTKPLDTPLADLANTEKVKDVTEITIVDGDGRAIGPATAVGPRDTTPAHAAPQAPVDEPPAPTPTSGPPARPDAPGAPTCGQCGHPVGTLPVRRVRGVVEHVECPASTPAPAPDDASPQDPDDVVAPVADDTSPPAVATDDPAAAALEVDDGGRWPCPVDTCDVFPFETSTAALEHLRTGHPEYFTPAAEVKKAPAAGRTADGKRGPRIAEPKPWEPYLVGPNGQTFYNLGSYAMQATEGMVLLAHDLLLERARTAAKNDGVPFEPPSRGKLLALARRLLRACDLAQAAVRPDGHADRMDGSHTRVRAAVRLALDVWPVPWGVVADELDAWVEQLAAYAATIVEVAVALIEPEPLPTPDVEED